MAATQRSRPAHARRSRTAARNEGPCWDRSQDRRSDATCSESAVAVDGSSVVVGVVVAPVALSNAVDDRRRGRSRRGGCRRRGWHGARRGCRGGVVVGGGGGTVGGVVAGGVVSRRGWRCGGVVVGGVVVGGVVVRRGVSRLGWLSAAGGVVVVVLGTWAAGLGLVVAAWELDMSSNPRARPPATRSGDHRDEDSRSFGHLASFEVVEAGCRVFAAAVSGVGTLIRRRRRKSSFGDVESWSVTASKPFSPPGRMYRSDPTGSIHGAARRTAAAHTAFGQTVIAAPRHRDRLGRGGGGGGGRHRLGRAAGIEGPSCEGDQGDHRTSPVCELGDAWSFGWLASSTPPATWARLTVPSGLGTLASPPGFRTVDGDPGTLAVALVNSVGTYLGYINVTPRQGPETLQDWAAFRLTHLKGDDAVSVHEDAMVQSVRTAAAVRSCVIDDYVTTVGHHQFHEVACYMNQRLRQQRRGRRYSLR